MINVLYKILCLGVILGCVSGFKRKKLPEKLTVHVINLDSKIARWKTVQELWGEHFNLIRFPARTSAIDPVCGLSLSHIDLMRQFNDTSSEDYLLLLEDDAFPTADFSEEFVHTAMEHAMRVPFWQVINFGPWFSKQPKVEPVDDYLVAIDYFHTTHFMGYHRRGVQKYLKNFAEVIEQGYCLAVDNYFGNYGTAKSQSLILASSKLMAIQNHGGESTIGGGPEMDACAINAALAGRRVYVHINEAPRHDIRPTFDPPVYGYKIRGTDPEEIVWSLQCNLAFDEINRDQVDDSQVESVKEAAARAKGGKSSSGGSSRSSSGSRNGEEESNGGGGGEKKKKKSKKNKNKKNKKKELLDEFDEL